MKRRTLLLLFSALTFAFATPADAAFIIKKSEAKQAEAPKPAEAPSPMDEAALADETAPPVSNEAMGAAVDEFRNLPRRERLERIDAARDEIRNFRRTHAEPNEHETNTLLLVLIAILLPPLAVALHERAANSRFWLSLLLWLLFYIPGLIYALIIILR